MDLRVIPSDVLRRPLAGRHLPASTLEMITEEPTLLVFLRHFGCMFCRETVRRLRQLRRNDPDYPRVVLVHLGTPEQGAAFFQKHWPRVPAVADPQGELFDACAIPRGELGQVLGPGVLASGLRAALRGNGIGKPVGDVWRMPGAFLVHRGHILWSHTFRHVGDQPDYAPIPALLEARSDTPPRVPAG